MAKLGKAARKRRGRAPKTIALDRLRTILRDGDGVVFMDNRGLNIQQLTSLRVRLRTKGCALRVAKNTLIKLALREEGYDLSGVEKYLAGPTMVAVGLQDPVTPAKEIMAFVGELEDQKDKIVIKGGMLEGKPLSAAGVDALSKLPGREQLISQMLGSLQAPAQNLVYALNAAVGKIVYAVDAYRRKLEEGDQAA